MSGLPQGMTLVNPPTSSGGVSKLPPGMTPFSPTPVNHLDGFSVMDNTNANKASFPSTGNESVLGGVAKTVGNMPSSAVNFGKSLVDFFNPMNTVKAAQNLGTSLGEYGSNLNEPTVSVADVAKEVPGQAYKALVPQFLQHLFSGDIQAARATIQNDPVGQIAPFLLLAKGAAEKAGMGTQFDSAVQKITSPVTKTASVVTKGIGNVATQAIGAETGAGASSLKTALNASPEFQSAMRGQTTPEQTVTQIEDAFQQMKNNRATEYTNKLNAIKGDQSNLDVTPIHNELVKQLNNFKIGPEGSDGKLNFSQSTIRFDKGAQADIQNIYDTMKQFGTQSGDRTPVGVDSLKRAFGDLYSPSSSVRAFTQGMKSATTDLLNKNVKGYQDMTSGYAKASDLLDEIKSATSAGKGNSADTVFTKVTTALKSDKDFRLQMLNELQNGSGQKIIDAVAGHNLSKWIPSGLIGRGIDVSSVLGIVGHVFNPSMIPALLTTSPRVVGEFLNAVGVAKQYVAPILDAVNKLPDALNQNESVKNQGQSQPLEKSIENSSSANATTKPSLVQKAIDYYKNTPNKQGGFVKIGSQTIKEVPETTKAELIQSIDYLRNGKSVPNIEDTVSRLAQKYGISEDLSNSQIANKFQDLIELTKTKSKPIPVKK